MQLYSCRTAWAGPSPQQAACPARESGRRPSTTRPAPPTGPLVLERRAAEPAEGQGAATRRSAGRLPATAPLRWQHSSPLWQLDQQHWQPAWALQGAGATLLVDPREAWPTSSAAAADGDCLQVQLNEPPPRPPPQLQQGSGDGSGGPGGGGRDPDQQDFFANVGDAIRTLREDYPLLFVKDLNCEWGGLQLSLAACTLFVSACPCCCFERSAGRSGKRGRHNSRAVERAAQSPATHVPAAPLDASLC